MLDRTNAHFRALVKVSLNLGADMHPELLLYREAGHTRFGLNLTRPFGQAVIGYLEWAGGNAAGLEARALADGVKTHVLPASLGMAADRTKRFSNDLAVGVSYATAIGIDLNLEYDYHQAGFSDAEWRNWFDSGADPRLAAAMWFVRGFAGAQREPVAKSCVFVRADWRNAFVPNLALTAFVDADLRDGSGLAQVTADYDVSPRWTVGALADVYFGRPRSDFGSLPKSISVLVKVSRYF
jgi:hypothetical protein